MVAIYRGDDSSAFNTTFITIKANIPEGQAVTKAKFKIGNLPAMTFDNPVFPLKITLKPSQTRQLQTDTTCYLAVYDSEGRKATCKGSLKFVVKDEVVF